jgi:hypothetical protein
MENRNDGPTISWHRAKGSRPREKNCGLCLDGSYMDFHKAPVGIY